MTENLTLEIKNWLEDIFAGFSIDVPESALKGEGYIGDIFFVNLKKHPTDKKLAKSVVLKCSKKSPVLRESVPVRLATLNEIFMYDRVFPAFARFQKQMNADEVFDSVPKCYGTFVGESMEALVFSNLREGSFYLWDSRNPMTLSHIDLVVKEYAKWHVISIAMREKVPKIFRELANDCSDVMGKLLEAMDPINTFGSVCDDIITLMDHKDDNIVLEGLRRVKNKIAYILFELRTVKDSAMVITHGDCWNNNIMFKYQDSEKTNPVGLSFIDWQVSRMASPIFDLSHFLFCSISEEDIDKVPDILQRYYQSFSAHLRRLGCDADQLYPYQQLLDEWKRFACYGILLSTMFVKVCLTDKDKAVDSEESAEKGLNIAAAVGSSEIQNKAKYRDRMKCVFEYAMHHDLL